MVNSRAHETVATTIHWTFIISTLIISLQNQLPLVKSLGTDDTSLTKCSQDVYKSCNAICGEGSCKISRKLNQSVCQCSEYPRNEGQSPDNGIQEYECHGDTSCMEVCNDLTSNLTNVFFRPHLCSVTSKVLETETGTGTASESSSVCACAIFEFDASASSRDVRDDDGETDGDGDKNIVEEGVETVVKVLTMSEKILQMLTEEIMEVLTKAIKIALSLTRRFLTIINVGGTD